jgi:hypothetical protein
MIKPGSKLVPNGAVKVNEDTPINIGQHVKIGVDFGKGSEIFWAIVVDKSAIDLNRFLVCIDQDLELTRWHGLSDKDELVVERKHISYVL